MWLSSGIKKLASPATWWEDLVPKTVDTKELREFAIYVHSIGTSIGDVERLHSLFTKCRAANLTSHAPAQPHASSRSQHTWPHPMCTPWQPAGREAAAPVAQEHEQADQVRHERALPQAEVGRGEARLVFGLSRERGGRGHGAGNDTGVKCVGVFSARAPCLFCLVRCGKVLFIPPNKVRETYHTRRLVRSRAVPRGLPRARGANKLLLRVNAGRVPPSARWLQGTELTNEPLAMSPATGLVGDIAGGGLVGISSKVVWQVGHR